MKANEGLDGMVWCSSDEEGFRWKRETRLATTAVENESIR